MFFGIQDVQFLPLECKSCSKEMKGNTDQPFDTSCKYQESCLPINMTYFISTSPGISSSCNGKCPRQIISYLQKSVACKKKYFLGKKKKERKKPHTTTISYIRLTLFQSVGFFFIKQWVVQKNIKFFITRNSRVQLIVKPLRGES